MRIKHRRTGDILYSGEFDSFKDMVEQAVLDGVSLSGADLAYSNIRELNVKYADFTGATFHRSNLSYASIIESTFDNADLSSVLAFSTNFSNSDFTYANFTYSELSRAIFDGSVFTHAILEDAYLCDASLAGVYLNDTYMLNVQEYYSFVDYNATGKLIHCIRGDRGWNIKDGDIWCSLEDMEYLISTTTKSEVYLANLKLLKGI